LRIAGREFNQFVIWIGWQYSESSRNKFDTTALRFYGDFAAKNNMTTRGHMLVWPADLPDWVKNGNFSRDELTAILRNHITQIVTPYKGKINEWVVVNEPYFNPYRQNDIFYKTIGLDYIEIAFRAARESDPSATLIYNDALNETAKGLTTQLTHQIVQMLKSKDLIDGVGIEGHMLQYQPMPDKNDVIATMRSYGVPVYVTEFDVNLKDVSGTQEQRFAFQANAYKEMLEACLESGVCKGFTIWGISDKNSVWETQKGLDGYSPKANPLLYDDNLNPKPAYFALLQVLQQFAQQKSP